jgi:hypothetical protein
MRNRTTRALHISKELVASVVSSQARAMRTRRRQFVLAAVCVCCIGFPTLAVTGRPAVARELAQSFTRQPSKFCELYFTDPDAVSTPVPGGQVRQLSFTVVNHQGGTAEFPFAVTIASGGPSRPVAAGSLLVASGEAKTARVSFLPPPRGAEFVVTISLVGRPELIRLLGTAV